MLLASFHSYGGCECVLWAFVFVLRIRQARAKLLRQDVNHRFVHDAAVVSVDFVDLDSPRNPPRPVVLRIVQSAQSLFAGSEPGRSPKIGLWMISELSCRENLANCLQRFRQEKSVKSPSQAPSISGDPANCVSHLLSAWKSEKRLQQNRIGFSLARICIHQAEKRYFLAVSLELSRHFKCNESAE